MTIQTPKIWLPRTWQTTSYDSGEAGATRARTAFLRAVKAMK